MAKRKHNIDTTEVTSTKQVLETGTEEKFADVDYHETKTVETTKAVFEKVDEGFEHDKERGAHQAVFEQGEPRRVDEERDDA